MTLFRKRLVTEKEMTMDQSQKDSMLVKIWSAVIVLSVSNLNLIFDFCEKIAGKEGVQWADNFKRFLRKEEIVWVIVKDKLLKLVTTVVVAATTKKFVAKEHYVLDTSDDAPVKFGWFNDNFKSWFLTGEDKIEDPINEQTIGGYKLLKNSLAAPIIAELGGETNVETTLTELHSLLKKQGKGKKDEKGDLLTNGFSNIFYIKDISGVLQAVYVYWDGGSWDVSACSTSRAHGWSDGDRVFSRNS
jgi:hypothetical protein